MLLVEAGLVAPRIFNAVLIALVVFVARVRARTPIIFWVVGTLIVLSLCIIPLMFDANDASPSSAKVITLRTRNARAIDEGISTKDL